MKILPMRKISGVKEERLVELLFIDFIEAYDKLQDNVLMMMCGDV